MAVRYPLTAKTDGFSSSIRAKGPWIFKLPSHDDERVREVVSRVPDVYGNYVDAEGVVHKRDATGVGMFCTLLHVLSSTYTPLEETPTFLQMPLGWDTFRESCVRFVVANGGGCIKGEESLANNIAKGLYVEEPYVWDDTHHVQCALKSLFRAFPDLGQASDVINSVIAFCRTPRRWSQVIKILTEENHAFKQDVSPPDGHLQPGISWTTFSITCLRGGPY